MSNLRLGVEVVSATDLMPKDGQGSCSSYAELNFDGQRYRTTVKEKDLNPVWNERFYFNISNPALLPDLAFEAYLYSNSNAARTKSFLGKVRLAGTSFVPFRDAAVMHYPLEKRGIFSRVKGELHLRVYLTEDPSIRASNPLPAINSFPDKPPPTIHVHRAQAQPSNPTPVAVTEKKKKKEEEENRHTFRHLPKSDHHSPGPALAEPSAKFAADEKKPEQPKVANMYAPSPSYQPMEYALKETSPFLGVHAIRAEKPFSTYDLVETMQYLFVRVVKARHLPNMDISGSLDPYVEVRVGNYKGRTRAFDKNQNPEWNEVFAFSRDRLQSSVVDVLVKDKDLIKDDFVGIVRFDINDVPARVPPDSPLAPEWYRLESMKGEKVQGELMLAVWMGTQADESFPYAWNSEDVAASPASSVASQQTRSKIYHAPRLWYVRVNIIEAQDVVAADRTRFPNAHVRVQIGNQAERTRSVQSQTLSLMWNEEFMFVAAEPFEDLLVISLEDRVGPSKDEVVGSVAIPLGSVDKRVDDRVVNPRWYSLERKAVEVGAGDADQAKKDNFSSRVHVRVSLDGGYHVLDESIHYSSDLRPTSRQIWKPSVGLLELGILNAEGLHPMKSREGKGTLNPYCVAKYGQKWVRTRTIVSSLSPRFNEQYTWEVYDTATVLTVGVFDNSHIDGSSGSRDAPIGKVRIRLSMLQAGRVYTNSYPLVILHPSGVKKMGELHLAIRLSSTSFLSMMSLYSRPLLPKMHYVRPLTALQQERLRHQAVSMVAARLGRMEPPLRKEVVDYMSDTNSHLWSMRKSQANLYRFKSMFSGVIALSNWFQGICAWKRPVITVLVHMLFVMLACFPELLLPTVFLYLLVLGLWNYRYRSQQPPHMDIRISNAETVRPDELDEEFDSFPTSRSPEIVRMRYDRLRSLAGILQTTLGDIAAQGERVQALISWRDPRATVIFLLFCFSAALLFYTIPFQVVATTFGFYVMRHPRFRRKMPSAPFNFFRRLPARTDTML